MVERARSPWRYLAPIILVLAALVVYAVLVTSGGEEEPAPTSSAAEQLQDGRGEGARERTPETYEIQSGDTIDSIAEETGVPAEEILELNPDVDPQALTAGQELRLSE